MIVIFLPELILTIASLSAIMLGAFIAKPKQAYLTVYSFILATLIVAMIAIFWQSQWFEGQVVYLFGRQYIYDDFSSYTKLLILVGSFTVLLMGAKETIRSGMNQFEYPILMLLAVLGMLVMVSANHLMMLYVGLELQSLSLYVMIAFRRDSIRESEAALKYFILGSLSSGILLYGVSLVYGFTGSFDFQSIADYLFENPFSYGAIVGLVLIIAGIAFKLSLVPFHMWTPDVYEGTATQITLFFAAIPKIAALILFVRILMVAFIDLKAEWQPILMILAMLSMAVGAFAAIAQSNLKRLLAYSTIGHMGYVLMGLATASEQGIIALMIYLPIYVITTIGLFGCLLLFHEQHDSYENISDLSGLLKLSPGIAVAILIFMFSMAGVPPFAGFFAKFYVFSAALSEGLYGFVIFAAITSVISAFYYLRIVKIMFFDNPKYSEIKSDNLVLRFFIFFAAAFVTTMLLWPRPIIYIATLASGALF